MENNVVDTKLSTEMTLNSPISMTFDEPDNSRLEESRSQTSTSHGSSSVFETNSSTNRTGSCTSISTIGSEQDDDTTTSESDEYSDTEESNQGSERSKLMQRADFSGQGLSTVPAVIFQSKSFS